MLGRKKIMKKKMLKIGINGFGRIGRNATRIILERPTLQIGAINSRATTSSHAYLLKYDSIYGTLGNNIKAYDDYIEIDRKKVTVFNSDTPAEIPWNKAGIDIVIDSTGKFRTSTDLIGHLTSGVRYVVLSAPAKDAIKTLVLGINQSMFNPKVDKIISNSSCTTNCLSTTLKVLHDDFHVTHGFMTTIHAVTDSQNLLDNSHKKEVRLRRAAFSSMIPATTGSAKDIGKLYPDLAGKIICQAIRIPLPTVSIINLTVEVKKSVTREIVNKSFEKEAKGKLKGILTLASDELVSADYIGSPYSSVVDPYLTQVIGNKLINVYAWYDNEWGYANRLVDMVEYIGRKAELI